MTAEQQLVLTLVRSSITNESFSLPENCDWNAVLAEAREQSVLLAVFDALSKYEKELPKDFFSKCFQYACAYLANNAKVGHVQKELNAALAENNVPYVILKGEAAASYYDKPEQRILGDVDFLVPADCQDIAGEKLEKLGYERVEEDHVCHIVYRKPSALCELHFDLSGMPKGDKALKVRKYIDDIFEKSSQKDIGGGSFSAPCDHHHAVIILLHMQHHMTGEGIGLRHLCDWAYFIKKTADAPFWNESLIPFLKEIGLYRFAKTVTLMCSLYLGVSCPDWAADADALVAERLFLEILEGGNFGRKDEYRTSSQKMVANRGDGDSDRGKIHNLYENLKCSVKEKHLIVKKAPFLFPAFFVYRAGRYFLLMLFGKKTPLHKSIAQADKRMNLYDELCIFKEETKDGKF